MRPAALLVIAALAAMPAAASASTLTANGVINSYNLVTSGNVSTSSDVEGSSVIGGTLSGNNTFFNADVPANPVLYLYGTHSGSTNVNAGGKVYYGGGTGFTLNGGTQTIGGWPNAIGDYTSVLNAYSTQLKLLTAQAGNSVVIGGGNATFNATQADANGVAVFSLTAGLLATDLTNANVQFSLGSGVKTIVINVAGSFSTPGGMNFNSINTGVLFNFYSASTLSLGNWGGSVLAPSAAVTLGGGAFNGFLYASSVSSTEEIHNHPITTPLPPPANVPEPASIALLGMGLFGIGALRRVRRA